MNNYNYNDVHVTCVSSTNPQFNYPGVEGLLRYLEELDVSAQFWPNSLSHHAFYTSRIQEIKKTTDENNKQLITLITLNSTYVFSINDTPVNNENHKTTTKEPHVS